MVLDAQSLEISLKVLIISDGKAGHENQSIAFAKLKKLDYDIVQVHNKLKFLTYILDFFHIYINLFPLHVEKKTYAAVVSTGSSTYYANKYLSKELGVKSIAIMLPHGFRYSDFDYILASNHDAPPQETNIISMPLNLSLSEPKGFVKKTEQKALGIIIGGSNSVFTMESSEIKKSLDEIFKQYPEYLKYITTSRRTPKEVDKLLEKYTFDYEVIYSKNSDVNPIADFIATCDELFITIDSTSMLSEARANSDAKLHIIDLKAKKSNTKFHTLTETIKNMKTRFDYQPYLDKVVL
jgi:hypothetical protein